MIDLAQLRVVHHAVGAIDRAGWDAGLRHDGVDVGNRALARPFAYERVEFGLPLTARVVSPEARIFGPFRFADHLGETREDLVLIGADDDVAVVARISVRGSDAGEDGA